MLASKAVALITMMIISHSISILIQLHYRSGEEARGSEHISIAYKGGRDYCHRSISCRCSLSQPDCVGRVYPYGTGVWYAVLRTNRVTLPFLRHIPRTVLGRV